MFAPGYNTGRSMKGYIHWLVKEMVSYKNAMEKCN